MGEVPADVKKPSAFDLAGKYKLNAWKQLTGTSSDEAKKQYVGVVQNLAEEYGEEAVAAPGQPASGQPAQDPVVVERKGRLEKIP